MRKTTHITEDDNTTLDELYEQTRIENLPYPLQQIALKHALDQWEAEPDLVTRLTEEVRRTSLRQ
jgi:hypothetical protein